MSSRRLVSAEESISVITPHARMELIIAHKKASLLEQVGLPDRIRNLLGQRRDLGCSVDILAYVAFPYSKDDKPLDTKKGHFRQLLRSGLLSGGLRDNDLLEIKTAVQNSNELTEHTRITVMKLLDEKKKYPR